MARSIVTLTTDFGGSSGYVAQLKGSLLSRTRDVQIVDVCHEVPPQDVRYAARLVDEFIDWFPVDAVHVVVVDPGVGTARPLVLAQFGGRRVLGPDNGVFDRSLMRQPVDFAVRLEESSYWNASVSRTFHGRDILAPVAGRLLEGLAPSKLGPSHELAIRLSWPTVRVTDGGVAGVVERVDRFGNLITNLDAGSAGARFQGRAGHVSCGSESGIEWVETYGDRDAGSLVALVGSLGRLEIAVVGGSAAERLGVGESAVVAVEWLRLG